MELVEELERQQHVLHGIPRDIGSVVCRASKLGEDLVRRQVEFRLAFQKLGRDLAERVAVELVLSARQLHEVEVQHAGHLEEHKRVLTVCAAVELPGPGFACAVGPAPEAGQVDGFVAEIVRQDADTACDIRPVELPRIPADHDVDGLIFQHADPFRVHVHLGRARYDLYAVNICSLMEAHHHLFVRLGRAQLLECARDLDDGVFGDAGRGEGAVVGVDLQIP